MASPDLFVIAAFCGLPLVTLAHELGHAWASMRFTDGPVEVYVGRTDCALRFRAGRLRMSLSPIGGGGLCRSSKRGMSREQLLIRALAGPGVNVALALAAWLVGDAMTGAVRAALFTVAAISALQILNLVPRWGVWGPLRKGVPSDGLQALCLMRGRPLPPPPTKAAGHGLNDPVGWSQIIGMVAALAIGALLVARAIPVNAVYIFAGLALQQALDARAPRLRPAEQAPAAQASAEPMKICPNCGAQIRRAARLCYCYQTFDPQPQHPPTTVPPAPGRRHSTGHLGRIVLCGFLLVIATIALLTARNEMTCGRLNCNVSAESAAPSTSSPDSIHP